MEFVLIFQCLGIGIVTIFCWWIWQHLMLRKSLSALPRVKGSALFGTTLQLLRILREDRYKWFVKKLLDIDGGLCVIWFAIEPRVFIRKPWQVETVLRSTTLITKSHRYNFIKPWLGNGLITSTGDIWRRHRRLITPAFHFGIMENFTVVMREKVEILNECIQTEIDKNPKAPINVYNLIIKYTLDTICETAMGLNLDIQRKPNCEYVTALNTFARLVSERFMRPWLIWDFLFSITENGKEQKRVLKTLHDFTEKVIKQKQMERKQQVAAEETNNKEEINEFAKRKRKAFLDLVLDENENSETSFTLSEMREEVDTFMFAGHDTTTSAIIWALFALGNEPEIQVKVQDEFKEVFGNDNTTATTYQLGQLKYLDRVVKEILRIYPSVPEISRNLNHDIIIDDYLIPKGTETQMSIYQLHHDPNIWEDPEKLDPDRFLPENCKQRHPYAYIPFSAGPRNCIGQKFALLEVKTALTAILRKWKVTSVKKPSEIKLVVNFILKPHDDNISIFFTPI